MISMTPRKHIPVSLTLLTPAVAIFLTLAVGATIFGGVYAWNTDGTRVDGFPYESIGREPDEFDTWHTYDQGFAGAPTIRDLDDDGAAEIVLPGADGRLYVLSGDGTDCRDIDECLEGSAQCPDNSSCTNMMGGYECQCNEGFVPNDSDACIPDPCLQNNGGAQPFFTTN